MDVRTDVTAQRMADSYDENKLILKVVEECMELCEVLVKRVTKAENLRPPMGKVIEEMGDVIFRMHCLAKKLQIEKAVDTRVIEKGEQLEEWLYTKSKVEDLLKVKQ